MLLKEGEWAGVAGPLYIEIAPQTFSVLVRAGTRLNQLRLKRGEPAKLAIKSVGVDLTTGIVGFRGRRHAGVGVIHLFSKSTVA